MDTHALPDIMYTLIPWACGPRDSSIHVRQNAHAYVMIPIINYVGNVVT